MGMFRDLRCCVAVFFISFLAGCVSMTETGERYRSSLQAIDEGQVDFAVIHLKAIVKDAPDSPYAPAATFALGEYYFDNADYFHAIKTLSDFIHNFPDDKGGVFARLIIYKIITGFGKERDFSEEEDVLVREIRKQLFSQPLFLIFYDKKTPRSYKSLFKNSYLVYDYVDKIKVFRNDKLFLELSP